MKRIAVKQNHYYLPEPSMIVYQNSLMKLEFDPAYSLMVVNWPNLDPYSLSEAKLTLSRLANTIRIYNIKNLLVDTTYTRTEIEQEDYNEVIGEFMEDISQTSLERIARLETPDLKRETQVAALSWTSSLPFEFRGITGKAAALDWLKSTSIHQPQ